MCQVNDARRLANMKLIAPPMFPNCQRVLMFLAEKDIDDINVVVDPAEAREMIIAHNPIGQAPILVLDDGTSIAESMSICRYLEGTYSEPNLLGRSLREMAIIDMWQRRAEFRVFIPAVEYGHHTHPYFAEYLEQHPAWGRTNTKLISDAYALLIEDLKNREFIAGDVFSVADITAYCGVVLAHLWGIDTPKGSPLDDWRTRISERPSAACVSPPARWKEFLTAVANGHKGLAEPDSSWWTAIHETHLRRTPQRSR
jgi:glutathione S-transferase